MLYLDLNVIANDRVSSDSHNQMDPAEYLKAIFI